MKKWIFIFSAFLIFVSGCEKDDFYGKDPQFYEKNDTKTISFKQQYGYLTVYYGQEGCLFSFRDPDIVIMKDYYIVNDEKWEIKLQPYQEGETMIYMAYNRKIIDSCRISVVK